MVPIRLVSRLNVCATSPAYGWPGGGPGTERHSDRASHCVWSSTARLTGSGPQPFSILTSGSIEFEMVMVNI